MRYATYIYKFVTKIHYLCFIFLILTYVQDVRARKCPGRIDKEYDVNGRCIHSKHPDCNVSNCYCETSKNQTSWRNTCYCCKVKS
nr:S-locus cysteine-rich protein [Raphanus sativus]